MAGPGQGGAVLEWHIPARLLRSKDTGAIMSVGNTGIKVQCATTAAALNLNAVNASIILETQASRLNNTCLDNKPRVYIIQLELLYS